MAVVNEVITEFGFTGDIGPLHDYNDALGGAVGILAGMVAATAAATAAVAGFVASTSQSLDPLIQLSRQTGIAVGELQELSFAAEQSGASSEALQSSIGALSEKIGEAAQQGSEDFARLGISVRDANGDVKQADDLLLEIGQRFKDLNLSLAEQRSFAARLGIDPSVVQLISKTSQEIDGLRTRARELGTLNAEQVEAADQLNRVLDALSFGFDGLRNEIAVGLAPQLEALASDFVDFIATNKELIADGIERLIEVSTALAEALVRLAPVIGVITAGVIAWKVASIGLAAVMGAIFSPVVIVTAGIAALLLIIDDLIVAMDGGQSVIADFFQEFLGIDIVPYLQASVDAAMAVFDGFVEGLGRVFDLGKQLAMGFVDLFTGNFDDAGAHFGAYFDGVKALFTQLFDELGQLFGGVGALIQDGLDAAGLGEIGDAMAEGLIAPIREAFTALFGWIESGLDTLINAATGVADFFGFGSDDNETDAAPPTQAAPPEVPQPQVNVGTPEVPQPQVNVGTPEVPQPQVNVGTPEVPQPQVNVGTPEVPAPSVQPRKVTDLVREIVVQPDDSFVPPQPETQQIQVVTELYDNIDELLAGLEASRTVQVDNMLSPASVEATQQVITQPLPTQMQALRPQPVTNSADNRSVSVEQNNTIEVRSTDPAAAGREIGNTLQNQLSETRANFSVGGF